MEACEDLAKLLATHHADVDTHLVLPASMRAADLRRVSEQYASFDPRKLLFTRLDETETFGPILSRSVRMGIPVSFFSRGQRIPEDLEPATADLLLDLILGPPLGRRTRSYREWWRHENPGHGEDSHSARSRSIRRPTPPKSRPPKSGNA